MFTLTSHKFTRPVQHWRRCKMDNLTKIDKDLLKQIAENRNNDSKQVKGKANDRGNHTGLTWAILVSSLPRPN